MTMNHKNLLSTHFGNTHLMNEIIFSLIYNRTYRTLKKYLKKKKYLIKNIN